MLSKSNEIADIPYRLANLLLASTESGDALDWRRGAKLG
jgi:hypothetical protein